MTFKSESIRQEFHKLPTSLQLGFAQLVKFYARHGLGFEIEAVTAKPLKVTINVTNELKDLTSLCAD